MELGWGVGLRGVGLRGRSFGISDKWERDEEQRGQTTQSHNTVIFIDELTHTRFSHLSILPGHPNNDSSLN